MRLFKYIKIVFTAVLLLFFTVTVGSNPVSAQEAQPGDACVGKAGYYQRSSMTTATNGGNMMFCDGANWLGFLNFTSSGNLGVWNASPATELDITGTGQMDTLNLNGVTGLVAPASLSAPSAIGDLTDVIITTPVNTEVLTYNGTNWVNSAAGGAGLWTAGAGDDIYYNTGTSQVGIGDTTPDANLEVSANGAVGGSVFLLSSDDNNDGDLFIIKHDGKVGIGDSTPDFALDIVGSIAYTGDITDVSDRRLKNNIQALAPQLTKIKNLKPVSFTMKSDPKNKTELGLIAQDVEKLYPELVTTDSDGIKSLNYIGLISPLIKAVKEQQSEIDNLIARIKNLENK